MSDDLFEFSEEESMLSGGELEDSLFSFDDVEQDNPLEEGDLPPDFLIEDDENRLARGVDVLESTIGSAGLAISELFGNEEYAAKFAKFRDEQRAEAAEEASDPDTIIESLHEAVPTIGAVLGTGAAGLAVGGPVGAMIGIGLGSLGLNLGTVREIQEQLDPKARANMSTVLGATGATAIDVATGGLFANAAKAPLKQAIKKSLTKEALKGTAIAGSTAAAAQGVMEVAGTIAADAEFDEDRLDSISNNIALATLMGSTIGLGASSGVAGVTKLRQLQDEADIKQTRERNSREGIIVVDREGNATLPDAVNPIVAEEAGLIKKGIVKLAGRAISPIVHLRKYPAISDLLDNIDQSRSERRNTKRNTHSNESELIKGEFRGPVDTLNAMSKGRQAEVAREVATGTAKSAESLQVKSLLKGIRQAAVKAGIKVGDLGETYLPFSPDVKKIKKDPVKFKQDMMEDASITLEGKKLTAFEARLDKYTENLIKDGGRNFGQYIDDTVATKVLAGVETGTKKERKAALRRARNISTGKEKLSVTKKNPLEMERFLKDISQDTLEGYTIDAPLSVRLNDYVNLTAERIAFAKLFGADGEKVHQKVMQGVVEAKQRNESIKIADIERIYNITNAMQRNYRKEAMSSEVKDVQDKIRAFQYIRTLPLATVSSLVEPFLVAEGIGAKAALTGLGRAAKDSAGRMARAIAGNKQVKQDQRFASDVNVSFMNALSDTAQRLDADAFSFSKMEGALFKWNGLAAWTEFNRLMAAYSAESAILKTLGDIEKAGVSNRELNRSFRKLEEAGIDASTALDWFRKGGSKNDPAYREIRKGIINLVNDVVVKPDASNRPLWHSDPRLQLVSQLKGWPTVFTTKVMTRWANKLVDNGVVNNFEDGAKLATFMTIYMAGLTTQTAIKDVLKDGQYDMNDKDMADIVTKTISQVGGLGLVLDPMRAKSFGSSALATIGGPSVSQGEDLISGVGNVLSGAVSPEEALRNLAASSAPNIPLQGLVKEAIRGD